LGFFSGGSGNVPELVMMGAALKSLNATNKAVTKANYTCYFVQVGSQQRTIFISSIKDNQLTKYFQTIIIDFLNYVILKYIVLPLTSLPIRK
jgi:hypothetical protein